MIPAFPWARIRWPKSPTGSMPARAARVTTHSQAESGASRGLQSMDVWSHVIGLLMMAVPVGLLGAGLLFTEARWLWLSLPPIVVWRVLANRRRRRAAPRTK